MAHQTNIRAVIDLLCSFCKKLGFSKVTPELFRQAKFNSSEASSAFWILLYEVLWYATYKRTADKGKRIEDIILFVKAVFRDLGYRSKEFFSSSELTGSRELLVAFGWLVSRHKVFDLLIDSAETSHFSLILRKYREDIVHHDESFSLSLGESLNYLLVCYNRSSMEWKNLRQLFQFIVRKVMDSDYHMHAAENSIQAFFDNATFLDIFTIFDNIKNQEQIIQTLEKQHRLLSIYLKWIKNEEIFWNWMISVVDNGEAQRKAKEHLRNPADIPAGSTNNSKATQKENPRGVNSILSSKISELSDLVSNLTQILLMVNWTQIQSQRRKSSCYDAAKPSSSSDEIKRLNENLQCFITEIEHKLVLLEEKLRQCFTLDYDEAMQDIIHLPPPRK